MWKSSVTKNGKHRDLKFLQASIKISLFQDMMPHSLADMLQTCYRNLLVPSSLWKRYITPTHLYTHNRQPFFLVKACYYHQPLIHLQLCFLTFPPNRCHLTGIPILPWRWGQQALPRMYPPTKLHSVTSKTITTFRLMQQGCRRA